MKKTNTKKLMDELKKYEPRAMHEHQLPVAWLTACNDTITDIDGKNYIDFTSGIFVTNVGHGTVAGAIQHQASRLIHSYTFPHSSRLNLHKKIREVTGYEKAFFLSSGTEATDCAVKIMRMNRPNASVIVSITGSMHGKSMCAEKLRGADETNEWAISHDQDFYHLENPFNGSFEEDMAVLTYKRAPKEIAGFIIESYRGWNAKFYNKSYIKDLMKYAKKHGITVCFDEIQGGFGRTGKLFAYEHYDVKPDLVCIGKGLGGGMPISAVLGSAKMPDLPDDLSSTHSANPVCCASALEALTYLQKNDLPTLAEAKGELLRSELSKLVETSSIKEINVRGLLAAIVFKTIKQADDVIFKAMKQGLLMVRTGRESIKIGPPLTITLSNLMEGIKIIGECLK